jgi:sugar/nucleoside kinase (ribokinase family)
MARDALNKRYDVLGLGIVTVDDVLFLPSFPEPDSKMRVSSRMRSIGGLTGAAIIAASRLGARCGYAGVLGDDANSDFVREKLTLENVDLSNVDPRRSTPPIHSTILVDGGSGSRTILFELPEAAEFGGDWPPEELIRSTAVLFIDHYDADRGIRAARLAREAGIPVVADFERSDGPRFAELLGLANHLIIGGGFARSLTNRPDLSDAIRALWTAERDVIVVTMGDEGCLVASGDEAPARHPAFAIEAIDTTGCGDVFHGAYAAALAWGWELRRRILFASAAAALRATARGSEAGIPRRAAVERLMLEQAR